MPTEADLRSELAVLEDDVAEFQRIMALTSRPGVLRVLRGGIEEMSKKMEAINERLIAAGIVPKEDDPNPCPPPLSEPSKPVQRLDPQSEQPEMGEEKKAQNERGIERGKEDDASGVLFGQIPKYAMDQTDKFVKVYVDLPGVGASDHYSSFAPRCFDFRAKGVGPQGKNIRFCIRNLYDSINISKSEVLVKADKFVVKLAKLKTGQNWDELDDVAKIKKLKHEMMAGTGATTEELLANMFHDADDETRASLSKAAHEGRLKREAAVKAGANTHT